MGVRRDAREAAVQYLYQREMQGDQSDPVLEEFYEMRGLSPSGRRFCDELLQHLHVHGGVSLGSTFVCDVIDQLQHIRGKLGNEGLSQ